ncbi:hypothetical protein ACROYT_G023761 [Oculina patagonica]
MMSSNAQKWQRKRPADSGDIDPDEDSHEAPDRPEDFKIKTLDEILQEKRRRIEKDDEPGEERNGSSEGNSRGVSPVTSARRESRTSSKQGSPAQGSEIIYQLSPEPLSLSPPSSTSGTPKKVKPQLSHDDGPVGIRVKKGRKTTEEEEGEIVSDPSDSESRRGEKRARRYSSISNPDAEENPKSIESKEKGAVAAKKSEESSEEEDSNEDESEDDTETATATKRIRKDGKDTAAVKQEGSESESGSESEESSSEDDDDDDDDGRERGAQKESKTTAKQPKETEVKVSGSKELLTKNNKDDEEEEEEEESSSEEESSEEDSEEEESESDSSEESEQKEDKKGVSQKTEPAVESTKVEEFESEDLHKELQQLKRHRSAEEKHKQKMKTERHHHHERVHRRRDESSSEIRSDKDRKTTEKEKSHSKYQDLVERRHPEGKSKSRSYDKGRSGDVHMVDSKQKEGREKHKSYAKESSTGNTKTERPGTREKHSEMEIDREKKSSRKDLEKRTPSTVESTKLDSKGKDRKGSRRKSSEKAAIDSRGGGEDTMPSKSKKDEGKSLVLTARERRQFTTEVVDIESEGSSDEDDKKAAHHSDSEMKLYDVEQEEDEKAVKAKLPVYYPAVRGCRNVEEFQWLNRIEEGTYGVVYRAKDRRTGDIVALKKLKMEREKEGFPITSLREINTLLKAQHPNIVTVREIVVGSNMDKIYIVMDYVEHDLKVLMEHMTQGFRIGEIKTLMIQLLRAVAHLHDNWILHRDLKASNLLLSNNGILKVGDFGLAREYGSPLKNYTPIVVTLWYRAPELLLGTKEYSTPIDLWSVGCIFAELLTMKPLFPGKSEIDQINRIFKDLGTPSDKIWPGPPSYSELPAVKKMTFTDYPFNNLRNKFGAHLTDKGFDLLNRFLTYDPSRRITADDALQHDYFAESPQPVEPSMFPTWPAKSEMAKRPKKKDVEHSPQAPEGGAMFAKLADEGDSGNGSQGFRMPTSQKGSAAVVGFTLKF